MRAMVTLRFGGVELFEEQDIERPRPGPGEVLVRVVVAGTNPVDAKLRADGSFAGLEPPVVLGSDVSGRALDPREGQPRPARPPPGPRRRLPGRRQPLRRFRHDRGRLGVDRGRVLPVPRLPELPVQGVLRNLLRRRLQGPPRRLLGHPPRRRPQHLPQLGLPHPAPALRGISLCEVARWLRQLVSTLRPSGCAFSTLRACGPRFQHAAFRLLSAF